MIALLFAQAASAPMIPRPNDPWVGTASVLNCRAVTNDLKESRFSLALGETTAALMDAQDVVGKLSAVAPIENRPPIVRKGAIIRNLNFRLDQGVVGQVHQLYQDRKLVWTSVVLGRDAQAGTDLGSEIAHGFCLLASTASQDEINK
jgi:hypothetical protein